MTSKSASEKSSDSLRFQAIRPSLGCNRFIGSLAKFSTTPPFGDKRELVDEAVARYLAGPRSATRAGIGKNGPRDIL
ncbi:hypothetical protein [Rothia uropygialis]|uniref:hypothetical protein n=1 Tax=Kocuria sp. 36 TaxID=1415402 RepID=UPI00101B9F1C|nr:hypothetical protein [Kocuria sp. 36]